MSVAYFEGNVTRDPELRFTQSGKAVVDFGVAVNRQWKDQNGETQEEVSFYDCSAWEALGQNIAESIHKGDRVVVIARMKQRTWDGEDGTKRSKVEFTVDSIGPSLRWATAQVTRNDKRVTSGAPSRPPVDDFGGEAF